MNPGFPVWKNMEVERSNVVDAITLRRRHGNAQQTGLMLVLPFPTGHSRSAVDEFDQDTTTRTSHGGNVSEKIYLPGLDLPTHRRRLRENVGCNDQLHRSSSGHDGCLPPVDSVGTCCFCHGCDPCAPPSGNIILCTQYPSTECVEVQVETFTSKRCSQSAKGWLRSDVFSSRSEPRLCPITLGRIQW